MEKLNPGIENKIQKAIAYEDTAAAYGSGLVEVFATPAMIALMEETALKSVQSLIKENETTVGFEVNVRHLRAVPVGEVVVSKSLLEKVEGRKLTFKVTVEHNNETVGEGLHVRYVIDKSKFK